MLAIGAFVLLSCEKRERDCERKWTQHSVYRITSRTLDEQTQNTSRTIMDLGAGDEWLLSAVCVSPKDEQVFLGYQSSVEHRVRIALVCPETGATEDVYSTIGLTILGMDVSWNGKMLAATIAQHDLNGRGSLLCIDRPTTSVRLVREDVFCNGPRWGVDDRTVHVGIRGPGASRGVGRQLEYVDTIDVETGNVRSRIEAYAVCPMGDGSLLMIDHDRRASIRQPDKREYILRGLVGQVTEVRCAKGMAKGGALLTRGAGVPDRITLLGNDGERLGCVCDPCLAFDLW